MNTRRRTSRAFCSACSSARAAAMSGRACSAAWRVFFEGDLVTLVEAPDRGCADLYLPFAAQQRADLLQRQIRLLGYEVEQPPLVVIERRPTVTCSRFGLNA